MDETTVKRINAMLPLLNERQRRLFLASEARALGDGGIAEVSKATGVSRPTIARGISELEQGQGQDVDPGHIRKPGAGRKRKR
ncbi:MAG: hypothetical protein LBL86_11590 [Coriobacteriales bacterium]|jgi:DNA-binding MurR/RpiR family transcriptional regulator|nr:hypothetical protein [Coriobacteriales bacterium]